jgi:vacuolar-type H+-ATPase subunit I/STV1
LVTELEGIANNSEAQGEKVAELGVAMKAFDDLLPENKQEEKQDAGEVASVDASVLEALIIGQKSQQDVQDKLLAIVEQVPAVMKSYEDKIKQLQDSVKDKDAQLNAVPKSVAAGNADASKLNGQEIAEAVNELEERKSGASNEPEDAISKMDRLAKEGRL